MASTEEVRNYGNTLLKPEFKTLNELLIAGIRKMENEFKMNTEWFEEVINTAKIQAARSLARNKNALPQSGTKGKKETVKKKPRKQKQDGLLSTTNLYEDTSMNDTTMSTRSRRAAARNASEKMKQGNIPMNKKLRRPTNFDELSRTYKRPQTDVLQPPTKYSRTRSNQSAGSSALNMEDLQDITKKEFVSSKMEADSTSSPVQPPKENHACIVLTRCDAEKKPDSGNDMFENDAANQTNSEKLAADTTLIEGKNNLKSKPNSPSSKEAGCGVKKLDETYKTDIQEVDVNLKYPVIRNDGENNMCFRNENENALPGKVLSTDEKTEPRTRGRVIRKKPDETLVITDGERILSENTENLRTQAKIVKKKCEDISTVENVDVEFEIKETVERKTRTKVIRKKQEEHLDNIGSVGTEHELKEIGEPKTRTKTIRKKQEDYVDNLDTESEELHEPKTRTKVLKKQQGEHPNDVQNLDAESEEPHGPKTRTKVLKKKQDEHSNDVQNLDTESEEPHEPKTRTKVLKKKQDDTSQLDSAVGHTVVDETVKNHLVTKEVNNEKGTGKGTLNKILNEEDCCADATEKTENSKTESKQINEDDFKKPYCETAHTVATEVAKVGNVNENEKLDQTYTKTNIRNNECQSRTKTIKKHTDLQQSPKLNNEKIINSHELLSPTSNELVKKRIEEYEKLQEESKRNDDCGRVTRTKTRAMAKEDAKAKEENADNKQTPDLENVAAKMKTVQKKKEEGKENIDASAYSKLIEVHSTYISGEKYKATPLSNCNRLGTPSSDSVKKFVFTESHIDVVQKGIIVRAVDGEQQKKKEEMLRRLKKADQARKKKEISLKATSEETRRKREDRLQKAAATREENARLKAVLAAQAEKEREEKLRMLAAEKEKQKEEQVKKKLAAQLKAQEIEERRKQEEAARLAKLREQEEEHRRLEAIRQRELDAAEQLHQKRLAEELRAQEAEKNKEKAKQVKPPLKQKLQQQQVGKTNAKLGKTVSNGTNSYHITPARNERPLLKPKNENDYGLDHAVSDDESSEDEENPKKIIPKWAQAANRARPLHLQSHLPTKTWDIFMTCESTVDLSELFGPNKLQRMRTSSQYWGTPPNINSCA